MTNILLRPYQDHIVRIILDSAIHNKGLTLTVEVARQGGKNEISSYLEIILLGMYSHENKNLIKCSPTFKPQTLISMSRLKERLDNTILSDEYTCESGHIIRLGRARAIFLSADKSANVVGNTAHLLLEVDEAQDVSEEKFTKEFKPMGSTTNCTTVLYGTTWDNNTLLEKIKQENLEKEQSDGIRRHFRFDWQEVARYNPDYLSYVESERNRLGENHPLFLTQYRLLPVHGGGGFFSNLQKTQLQGIHSRRSHPESGKIYVAGIDLAGEAETEQEEMLSSAAAKQDSTVITIGELDFSPVSEIQPQPSLKIVEHYAWTGRKHSELYAQMLDILKTVWQCRRVVVDATGIGQPVASFLRKALGSKVIPFTFTQQSKSQLGFNLLAAVNSGRLKIYTPDNSGEYKEFMFQIDKAQSLYRPSQTINFYVDSKIGHDDFLMSLALVNEAAGLYKPKSARGS